MRTLFQRVRRRVFTASPRPLILMYHRIGTPAVDPWGLAVSPKHFVEQLTVLCRTRTVLSMTELVSRLERRTLPANAAAVTFDDGYADNLSEASPSLLHAGVPATLFVATGFLDRTCPYWWDELATLILAETVPITCDVDDGRQTWGVSVGAGDDREVSRSWRAWQEPTTERQRVYNEMYGRLRGCSAAVRERVVASLRRAAGVSASSCDGRPMTTAELIAWSARSGLDVGAHTNTHPVLPVLDPAECEAEIEESKRVCERLVNRSVAGFAYPHGAHNEHVRRIVARNGFAWACTTEARALESGCSDLHALPRHAVADCDGPAFERWIGTVCID